VPCVSLRQQLECVLLCRPEDFLQPRVQCELAIVFQEAAFDRTWWTMALQPNAALIHVLRGNSKFLPGQSDIEREEAWQAACSAVLTGQVAEAAENGAAAEVQPRRAPATAKSDTRQDSDDKDYSSMTVAELKKELVARGCKVSGKKQELIDRLLEHESTVSGQDEPPPEREFDVAPELESRDAGSAAVSAADANGNGVDRSAKKSEPEPAEPDPASEPELESAPAATEDAAAASPSELEKLTVPQLKELLRSKSLKLSGKKAELVERCVANGLSAAPVN
jgi:SAP domain